MTKSIPGLQNHSEILSLRLVSSAFYAIQIWRHSVFRITRLYTTSLKSPTRGDLVSSMDAIADQRLRFDVCSSSFWSFDPLLPRVVKTGSLPRLTIRFEPAKQNSALKLSCLRSLPYWCIRSRYVKCLYLTAASTALIVICRHHSWVIFVRRGVK